LKGRGSADAFAAAQAARSQLRKRAGEQKEVLNLCVFEADRANFGAARAPVTAAATPAVPAPPPSPAPAAAASVPDVALTGGPQ